MRPKPAHPVPTLGDLFTTWAGFGLQSFGGGASTFLLIHRACLKRGWLSEAQFVRAWSLAQISPGINLVKLTALVGYKLRGGPGVVVTMLGMLLPSAAVTVLMTAGFALLRDQPVMQAAMRGILPATIGLSLATGLRMGRPLFRRAREEGTGSVGAHFALAAIAALLMATGHASPALILVAVGIATWAVLKLLKVDPREAAEKDGA